LGITVPKTQGYAHGILKRASTEFIEVFRMNQGLALDDCFVTPKLILLGQFMCAAAPSYLIGNTSDKKNHAQGAWFLDERNHITNLIFSIFVKLYSVIEKLAY